MVVETVAERERTSEAVINALKQRGDMDTFAVDLLETLGAEGIDPVEAISTVWRLIDENRLFLGGNGQLVLETPNRAK